MLFSLLLQLIVHTAVKQFIVIYFCIESRALPRISDSPLVFQSTTRHEFADSTACTRLFASSRKTLRWSHLCCTCLVRCIRWIFCCLYYKQVNYRVNKLHVRGSIHLVILFSFCAGLGAGRVWSSTSIASSSLQECGVNLLNSTLPWMPSRCSTQTTSIGCLDISFAAR